MKERLQLLRSEESRIKAQIAECEHILLEEYMEELQGCLASKSEPYGDITIGDIKFKVPKYVKWNQRRLGEIASAIQSAGEDPSEWIDCKFSITEDKFKYAPESLKELFNEARTVSAGKINIGFKEK